MNKKQFIPVEESFKELFVDLQLSDILDDNKQLADAIPLGIPSEILKAYRIEKEKDDFDLNQFFHNHFQLTPIPTSGFKADINRTIEAHIKELWSYLKRDADHYINGSSLIPLTYPYIVPGGRFNEIYYWDSFFTMLGLKIHKENQVIEHMIKNFSWMIDTIGFIPNGNRTYFLGRSQPPYFSLMIGLLAELKGDHVFGTYLPQLEAEYDFWMNKEGAKESHLVAYKGVELNRYYDQFDGPRPEMYGTDILDFEKFDRPKEYYKHIRAACESGWDFSSRWFNDPMDLSTITTLNILPVDLNCLLVALAQSIAKGYRVLKKQEQAMHWNSKAEQRAQAIQELFWNSDQAYFNDINFSQDKHTQVRSLAGMYPLYFNIATQEQAQSCVSVLKEYFLKDGGLVSTPLETGQQWDAPNGWAPLQYMSVIGLLNYGYNDLALEVINRWMVSNQKIYNKTAKLLEKYNVVTVDQLSGGGEYLVQDGFGWTNGVYIAFKAIKQSLV